MFLKEKLNKPELIGQSTTIIQKFKMQINKN